MIPDTTGAFIALLFFVAPGIIFQVLRERSRPAVEETTAREASRIALSSVVFSLGAALVLSAIRLWKPAWIVDPGAWARGGDAYFKDNYRLIARTVILEVLIAALLAVALAWILQRLRKGGSIKPVGAWYHTFRGELPGSSVPYLSVRLKDGTQYMGTLANYSPDPNMEGRELVLKPPYLRVKPTGDGIAAELDSSWQRVIIAGSAIDVITVAYRSIARAQANES